MTIALIGGTGPEGRGLALRLASAGHRVIIGSRSAERAQETAIEIGRQVESGEVTGRPNEEAAAAGEIVILTLPYAGLEATVKSVAAKVKGKIVVSAVAPIEFVDGRPTAIDVDAGSAAQEVQRLLPEARVVSGFQTIDAHQLGSLDHTIDTDVIVCSDDAAARHDVIALANQIPGVRALSGGRLAASRYVEACTGLLITVNRIYKVHSGFRLTGVDR